MWLTGCHKKKIQLLTTNLCYCHALQVPVWVLRRKKKVTLFIVTGLLHRGSYYLIKIQTIHCQFITFFLSSFCTQPESGAEFRYIDKWSSSFTWGGETPPEAGDLVQIPSGQIILLDVNTPVLSMLIIEGRSCCPK